MTEAEMLGYVTFDMEQSLGAGNMRCVVIGRDKDEHDHGDVRLHVLIISPASSGSDVYAYARVGVASVKAEHMGNDPEWVRIY